jgi:hypothetical protein
MKFLLALAMLSLTLPLSLPGQTISGTPIANALSNTCLNRPRPDFDITCYGASGSSQNTTATCVRGSTSLAMSFALDFQNGQGISLAGCGATPSVTRPTVHIANIGTAGSSTYSYSVATIDAGGGNSGYGALVSTSAGNATLSGTNYNAIYITPVAGARGYALIGRTSGSPTLIQYMPWEDPTSYPGVTATRAGNVVTATTSSTLSFFPTWFITMSGCSDSSFDGTFQVSITGQTVFQYSQTAAKSSATGCRVTVNPTFFDFGTNFPHPSTVALSFLSAAYPDIFTTKICGGAGTTRLTLCAAPLSSGGANVNHDDTAAIQAAMAAQHSAGSGTAVFCPKGTFRISSDLDVSSNLTLNGSGCTIDQINPGADVLRTTDSSGTTTFLSLNYVGLQGGRIGVDASDQAALVVFTADHLFLNTFDGVRASQNGIQWTLKNLFCQTQDWCIDASPAATIQGLKIDVAWFSGVGNGVWHDVRIPNTFGYSASFTCETCLWEGPTASWMVNSATPVGARMVFGAIAPVVLKNGQLSDNGTSSVNFIQTLPTTNGAPTAIQFDGGYYVADTAAYLVNTLPGTPINSLSFEDGVFDGGVGVWGGIPPNIVTNLGSIVSPALPTTNLVSLTLGGLSSAKFATQTNCSSSSSPAACGSAPAGSVAIAAASSSVVVVSSAVTANSQITITFDSSLGTKLGVTCNTKVQQPYVSARTAGTSFTISVGSNFSTNPGCFSYTIVN